MIDTIEEAVAVSIEEYMQEIKPGQTPNLDDFLACGRASFGWLNWPGHAFDAALIEAFEMHFNTHKAM